MTEATTITITINDRQVQVAPGTTVLAAAQKLGIEIPTLCHHEALSPEASCRVCIVEMSVEKQGKTYRWIDASCAYPVEDGLRVETDSPRVRRERKVILEFMLSRAPGADALLRMAEKYGARKDRFVALDKGESNCILCGRCVRVCTERAGGGAIGTSRRGVHKKVLSPCGLGRKLCFGCFACSWICPTGAIKRTMGEETTAIENWGVDLTNRVCVECGTAFAPDALCEKVAAKVSLDPAVLNKCPECRRKALRHIYQEQ